MRRFSIKGPDGETVQIQLRAMAAPILIPLLFAAVVALMVFIWQGQAAEIADLKQKVAQSSEDLATIREAQQSSLADRTLFQAATTARLDKLQDILTGVGQNLAALTAIQKQHESQLGG